jgi:Sigma-70 region 2
MNIELHLTTEFRNSRERNARDISATHISSACSSRATTIPATFTVLRESLRKHPGSESGAENRGKTVSNFQVNSQRFDVLFSKYRRVLYFVAHRMLGNHQEAEHALHLCFLSACENIPQFDSERRFRSWLVRVLMDEAQTMLHTRSFRSSTSCELLPNSHHNSHNSHSSHNSYGELLDFSPPKPAALQPALPHGTGRNAPAENWGWY